MNKVAVRIYLMSAVTRNDFIECSFMENSIGLKRVKMNTT